MTTSVNGGIMRCLQARLPTENTSRNAILRPAFDALPVRKVEAYDALESVTIGVAIAKRSLFVCSALIEILYYFSGTVRFNLVFFLFSLYTTRTSR